MKAYQVQINLFDAARRYAVVATFRTFAKVVGRYETQAEAMRRASELNRKR